jgi:predicted nucleic acid-binding protein
MKLLRQEPESQAAARYLNELASGDDAILSSTLLETELRRAASRQGLAQVSVTALLDRVGIFDLVRSTFTLAGVLPGANLRSLDALHIAAAQRVGANVIVSYDERLTTAAEAVGLRVVAPR